MIPEKFFVADVGNSRIKIACIQKSTIVPGTQSISNEEFIENPILDQQFSDVIVFASVNTKISEVLRSNNENMRILEIGKEIEILIKNKTQNPEQTGIDRLINCWAAFELYGKSAIVIDAGTAITIDYCNEYGEFEGGVIMAGYELQLRALNMFTSALPAVKFDENVYVNPIGRTTEEAMLAAVKYGIPGQIKACIDEISKHTGDKPRIIFTGGNSGNLENQLVEISEKKHMVYTVENLTIKGILRIACEYFRKSFKKSNH